MNASQIVNDTMTLEEKLEAIDAAVAKASLDYNQKNGRSSDAPIDPADLLMCEGCQ